MSGNIQTPSTGTLTITSGQAGVFPCSYGYYPQEGSRCISAQYSWVSATGYYEDLSQLQARGVETAIQGVFIDNSSNATNVQIVVSGTEQIIYCPANSQGIFPIFFTGTASFQITCAANSSAVTRCYFLNVPGGASVWHV